MLLKAIADFSEIPVRPLETAAESGLCAVTTLDRSDEATLTELMQKKGSQLIVHEVWQDILPQAGVMISSAICGGEAKIRFEEAAGKHSCWLLIEPIMSRFHLPCSDGNGQTISRVPEGTAFFSPALCCYYAHMPGSMFLWDTEESIYQKMLLAKQAGFMGYVYPEHKNTAVI